MVSQERKQNFIGTVEYQVAVLSHRHVTVNAILGNRGPRLLKLATVLGLMAFHAATGEIPQVASLIAMRIVTVNAGHGRTLFKALAHL